MNEREQLKELTGRIQVLTSLASRTNLAKKMGFQYGGERDIYRALGYPGDSILFGDYLAKWKRHSIAKAVINRPISLTWRGPLLLQEKRDPTDPSDDAETPFECEWKILSDALKLKSKFIRMDKLVSLGKYGAMLFGFDDVSDIGDFSFPVSSGNRKLLYIKPLSELSAVINETDTDTKSERYGLPKDYQVHLSNSGGSSASLLVHHSRILHISNELLEDEVEGSPTLEAIYNNLMDLEKIVGGSGEIFWRDARPGYQGRVDPDFAFDQAMLDNIRQQVDEYEHNLRRIFINEGLSLEALQRTGNPMDPEKYVDIQLQMISAVTGIPKRILTGSERGELASSQDREAWLEYGQDRRDEYAEPSIIRPFVSKCQIYGVLPNLTYSEYFVDWMDLWSQSDREKVEIGKLRTEALKNWTDSTFGADIVPSKAMYSILLGLDEYQITQIMAEREEEILEENNDFQDMDE